MSRLSVKGPIDKLQEGECGHPLFKKILVHGDFMKKPILILIVLCLSLSACNSGKNSPSSGHGTPDNGNTNPPEAEELPGTPTNLMASSGDRQVTLSWEAPSHTGTSAITHYEYQYSTTSGTFGDTWTEVPNWERALEITIPNLIGATTYFFRVRAMNTQGAGTPSSEIEATAYDGTTPTPGTPPTLTVTPGDHQVTLSWEAPSAGASAITRYEYQYRTASGTFGDTWTTVTGTGTTVPVTGLTGTYFFRVRAVNTQGAGTPSSEIEATAYAGSTAKPGAPTNLETTSGDRQVTLSWEVPSHTGTSAIIRYEYQYRTASGTFGNTWTRVTGMGTTVTGLMGATTYFFRVRAVNTQGGGHPTQVSVTPYDGPTPEPGAPPGLTPTSGDRQVTLSWEAPSAGASAITRYEYQYRTASGTFGNTWTEVSNWENALKVTIDSLIAGTTYHFQVRAVNAQGAGIPSDASLTLHDGINLETVCSDPATTDSALPGTGTVDNPFALCSPAHLSLIGDMGTNAAYTLSASYVMGQDIDLNNKSFTPIAGVFTGTLDGRNKKIMNLKIKVSGHGALFVELGVGGSIKNLGIEEFDVTGSGRVGSLVATSSGTITNCYAVDSDEATDLSGRANFGYVDGLVEYESVGGLVGYQSSGSLTSSYAAGNPDGGSGHDNIGGLVGNQKGGSVISSYATGNPKGGMGNDYVGGLVGHQDSGGTILSSYATGSPKGGVGNDSVGGLVGSQPGGSVISSYATGSPKGGGG